MNHKVAKAYVEMKESQAVSALGESKGKKQATLKDSTVKTEEHHDVVKGVTSNEVSFNLTDSRELYANIKKIVDAASMQEIEGFTEALKLCTFRFFDILNCTRMYNKDITRIKFSEAGTLVVTAGEEEYVIKFKKRYGRFSPMFMVRYSDNLNGSMQDYNYRVVVDQESNVKVNLESVAINDDDYYFYGGGKVFKFHLHKDEVEYDIMINSERIKCDPAMVESYISTLVAITSLNANGIYKGLIHRFGIKPSEREKIAVSEVSIFREGKTVSHARYVKGKLDTILFMEKGATYTLKSDGTWRYRRGPLDIDHSGNISTIWYNDSRVDHDPVALGKLKKFIRKKQISFFGVAMCD